MDNKLCPCDPILGYIIFTSTMLPENAVRNSWTKGSPCNSKCPCMSVNCPWLYVVLSTIIDRVETIKAIDTHSIHTEHIKAKSLGHGSYHTELIKIVTHF